MKSISTLTGSVNILIYSKNVTKSVIFTQPFAIPIPPAAITITFIIVVNAVSPALYIPI